MPHFQKDPHNFVCRQNRFLFQERNFSQKQSRLETDSKKNPAISARQKKDIALKILFHFIHQGTI